MGVEQAKPSQSNVCDFLSSLDKSICFPGESINGTIVTKVYKERSVKFIQIDIIQHEYWYNKQTKKTKSTNVTLNTSQINIMNTLKPAEYRFNFSVVIPMFTKSSFEYPLADSYAYIRTYIQASSPDLPGMTKQMILIKKPATILDSPLNLSVTSNLKLLFIEQGAIVIKGSYPSNNYSFHSQIPIEVSIDWAKSKLALKTCDASLIRKIKFLCNGVEDKSLIFEDILWHVTKPLSGGKCIFSESIMLSDTEEIKNKYTYTSNNITFPDKAQIIRFMPSIKTGFIDCDYFIKIVCSYDMISKIPLVDKPTLIMPLSVSHYSSIDLANSVIQIGQNLENQFNRQNNMNPMMSQYQQNHNQNQMMPPQQQPNPNQNQMMFPPQQQQGMMMSQYQQNNYQNSSQYQPNQNQKQPMFPPQNMNQYQPNTNMVSPQGNHQKNGNNNNMQTPNVMNQMNDHDSNPQDMENNYPIAESMGPPPSTSSKKNDTPNEQYNLYPKLP